jgi:hypothetical protein
LLQDDDIMMYLGIPMGIRPKRPSDWIPFLVKIQCALEARLVRHLNLAIRMVILKATLNKMLDYT